MPVPFFPLLGLPTAPQLLNPLTVCTPLAVVGLILCSLGGMGLAMLRDRVTATRPASTATGHPTPPALPKAA